MKLLITLALLGIAVEAHAQKARLDTMHFGDVDMSQIKPIPDGTVPPPPPPPELFKSFENVPTYPGGVAEYIQNNLQYPAVARKSKIQGRVVASFVVMEDGRTDSIKIIKSIGGGCDEEVERLIRNMAPWKLGTKPVKTHFNLPVTFSLNN